MDGPSDKNSHVCLIVQMTYTNLTLDIAIEKKHSLSGCDLSPNCFLPPDRHFPCLQKSGEMSNEVNATEGISYQILKREIRSKLCICLSIERKFKGPLIQNAD